ncbi:RDD family protein [Planotetraspora sp. A-T 1434]|uniref:RDD family protein n=1 Tax=Planotetraspora sp. A-T 1434 TaxID=2979219 RepID=UPI0021C15EE4|nr:RDD family protein [Planotetraspora sp. A-T 1434]MCT9929827.1 RDD family protein [Planotetraspora sp. A-T 1434]
MSTTSSTNGGTRAPAWHRIAAWLIDWLLILILPLLLVPVGVALYMAGLRLPIGLWNLISFLLLIAPVTLWCAWRESGRFQATPGKRAKGLIVVDAHSGRPIGFGRALLRNAAKIALPWELGHTVAYGFATAARNPSESLMVLTIIVYVIMFAWLGALFLPSTRTPYDLLGGTRVVREPASDAL